MLDKWLVWKETNLGIPFSLLLSFTKNVAIFCERKMNYVLTCKILCIALNKTLVQFSAVMCLVLRDPHILRVIAKTYLPAFCNVQPSF